MCVNLRLRCLFGLPGDEEMPAEGFGFLENGADVFSIQLVVQLTFFFCKRAGENRAEAFIADIGRMFEHAVDVPVG